MDNLNVNPFQIGQVVFRYGDLSETPVLGKSDVIILPTSPTGQLTGRNKSLVKRLTGTPPGDLSTVNIQMEPLLKGDKPRAIIFAVTAVDGISSIEQIANVCREITDKTRGNSIVSLPMLGSGTGKLDPKVLASLFVDIFNTDNRTTIFIVNVKDRKLFDKISGIYAASSTQLDPYYLAQKPLVITKLESFTRLQLKPSDYKVDENGILTQLQLTGFYITSEEIFSLISRITHLSLYDCRISDWVFLSKLSNLKYLDISDMTIEDFNFLTHLNALVGLQMKACGIKEIDFYKLPQNLIGLNVANNEIVSLEGIKMLTRLRKLEIANNKVENLNPLQGMRYLTFLDIRNNQVSNISPLANSKLKGLLLSSNQITDIAPVADMRHLDNLLADKNPFQYEADILLEQGENHKNAIVGYLKRLAEGDRVELQLPTKVLLLGNHATGKSSLLEFLFTENITAESGSTHIIKIRRYGANSSGLPEAVFFDFGGQDYYHGIYRAFLSPGSITLLLWTGSNNYNKTREDSAGQLTIDLDLKYWLSQKQYMEMEKFGGNEDPLLLIQTHVDKEPRKLFREADVLFRIDNEFCVSLQPIVIAGKVSEALDDLARRYLRASILVLIKQEAIIRTEPKWYVEFIAYVNGAAGRQGYHSTNVEKQLAEHYKRNIENKIVYLYEELDQLHKRGLVLYYKDIFPNDVWLDPEGLVTYIHSNILNKEDRELKGGRVSELYFKKYPRKILKLLQLQKVIFYHEYGKNGPEYIVPNFLPLSQEENTEEYQLLFFGIGSPAFTLKFTRFIPFGLINQVICAFGLLPDKKKFWRDQVLFTLEHRARILIKLDFEKLEIRVYISFLNNVTAAERANITRYIFYGIMVLYWDMDMLSYQEFVRFYYNTDVAELITSEEEGAKYDNAERIYQVEACRPLDLFISVDEQHFVQYTQLAASTTSIINSYFKTPEGTIKGSGNSIAIFPFEAFIRRNIMRPMKIAISYSKQDIVLVDKLRQHLVPLSHDGLIENPWYCTMLEAGQDWNAEIKARFEAADIVIFMISENLMSTQYVMDNEVKNAIDRWDAGSNIKIIPILLRFYHWARKGKYNLARFNGFPYTMKPVTDFDDQNMAWYMIEESIRMMIEKNLNPLKGDGGFTKEMEQLHHRIINENKQAGGEIG
jgi:Leucine-rich repeat (LRR) protein